MPARVAGKHPYEHSCRHAPCGPIAGHGPLPHLQPLLQQRILPCAPWLAGSRSCRPATTRGWLVIAAVQQRYDCRAQVKQQKRRLLVVSAGRRQEAAV